MNPLPDIEFEDAAPKYVRIAHDIVKRIEAGEYEVGSRLPAIHVLAARCGVAVNTAKQATDLLSDKGYLIKEAGRGTFIRQPRSASPRAMVVDDDLSVRELLSAALVSGGWSVDAVESAEKALEKYSPGRYHLAFIDLVLPGKSGVEVFKTIAETRDRTLVVIVTGYPEAELMAQALEYGPFTVLKKPFTMEKVQYYSRLAGLLAA